MKEIEYVLLLLLLISVAQTTYLTVRHRGTTKHAQQPVFVDTSVLMDGRIVSIAETGFVPGSLIVPRSVIAEMQLLADNGDADKRERARRGLDVVKQLQDMDAVSIELMQDGRAPTGVDDRLLELAKRHSGMICTIDFNLNKVAQVEGIRVLNVNELAKQLRMVYLPGDTVSLALTQKGQNSHQAVGHLDDGTMVVVEKAHAHIGETLAVEVIRNLQTDAGRMIFAKIASQTAKQSKRSVVETLIKKPLGRKKQSSQKSDKTHARSQQKSTKKPSENSKPAATPTSESSHKKPEQRPRAYHASPRNSQKQSSSSAPRKRKTESERREDSLLALVESQNNK